MASFQGGTAGSGKDGKPISSTRLAELIKIGRSTPLPSDSSGLPEYKVYGKEFHLPGNKLRKVFIGEPKPGVPEKVLMLVGATGAGKSTLINGMINYIFGVEWEDNFRFKLIQEEAKSKVHSQTCAITAYTIYCMEGSLVDHTLTIIDTPGFGDTSGLKRDKEIRAQIKEFFFIKGQSGGISHINGIGFVVNVSLVRLTHTQKYIFDSVLSIFGKDIAENIFILVTFADGNKPAVMSAINEAKIPNCGYFKFNNSAIFTQSSDDEYGFDEMFWKMGMKPYKSFFISLQNARSVSLTLTKNVLQHREYLEALVFRLQYQIKKCIAEIDELEQEK